MRSSIFIDPSGDWAWIRFMRGGNAGAVSGWEMPTWWPEASEEEDLMQLPDDGVCAG